MIPGLIIRMHKAMENNLKEFNIWGTGKPLREFLYIDDLALALEFLIFNQPSESLLNIGSGEEISIYNLAKKLKNIIGFDGELVIDESMPDGNPRKLLDSRKINEMGWKPTVGIDKGLESTYNWYKENIK